MIGEVMTATKIEQENLMFDVDSNIKSLSDNIIEGSDIIYTSPIMYDKLTKLGWTPLVVRNFDLSPSYIVKKGNEAVNLSGLKDKKVVSYEPTLLNYAIYNFIFRTKICKKIKL